MSDQREKVAIAIWHRHAPAHHIDWDEEPDQEIYLFMADAAIEAINDKDGQADE